MLADRVSGPRTAAPEIRKSISASPGSLLDQTVRELTSPAGRPDSYAPDRVQGPLLRFPVSVRTRVLAAGHEPTRPSASGRF
jgi:hypothetical protein